MTDETPPGRELDALVAEKVMGEPKPTGNVPDGVLAGVMTSSSGGGNWIGTTTGYTAGDEPVWLPKPYSTDISPAFEVVDKLKELPIPKEGSSPPRFLLSYAGHDIWKAGWDTVHGYRWFYGESAAHATCLAALKAVEGALEEIKEEQE